MLEAELDVTLRAVVCNPAAKLEVAEVDVAWKYGAAICLQASSPPAKVEMPTAVTAMFLVVEVGAMALSPKVLVVTAQSLNEDEM